MNRNLFTAKRLALPILLLIATFQFFQIFTLKLPYTSDSLFYKHLYYQFQGDNPRQARQRVLTNHKLIWPTKTQQNMFTDENAYHNSSSYFTQRLLYPFTAYVINLVLNSEFLAFLLPVLVSYLLFLTITFALIRKKLAGIYPYLAIGILITYQALSIWATYFVTDVISAMFWMMQLLIIYKFLTTNKKILLIFFAISFVLSLAVRQQNLLLLLLPIFLLAINIKKPIADNLKQMRKNALLLLALIVPIEIFYFLISALTHQKTILDHLIYTQNDYGYLNNTFTPTQIFDFYVASAIKTHLTFLREIVNGKWQLVFIIMSLLYVRRLFQSKSISLLDLLMLLSAVCSYLGLFAYPFPNTRYYFPLAATVVYFSLRYLQTKFAGSKRG